MKGKQLIKKLTRPPIVFVSGVLIVFSLIISIVVLHVSAVNRGVELSAAIDEIHHTIFAGMADLSPDESTLSGIENSINFLLAQETLEYLRFSHPELDWNVSEVSIKHRNDLLEAYEVVEAVKAAIDSHTVIREESFRVLYLLIVVTIIAMILFLGISQYENYKVLRYEQVRNKTNNNLYDQLEKERSLIAFELHDDIAQKLAVIKRYFNSRNSIDDHTVLMENYATEVIRRVRYLSRMLKAPDNPDVSFNEYLETLFSDFNVLSDFKLNRKTIGLNALKLNPSAALHIYRIIQEILTNSRIHSEATEIDLLLVYSHPTLNIKYKDNGKGFDPYLVYRKGIGLDSIKYRLEILQGEYHLNSAKGEGTDISIDIPVELCEIS